MTIDLKRIDALDFHAHIEASVETPVAERDSAHGGGSPSVDDVADHYRTLNVAAVVFTVDVELTAGSPVVTNEEIAAGAARHSDVLIPFGSIDPARPDATERARRLVTEHGIRGFKFHPGLQRFYPSDERAYPLYAEIERLGVPAIFHTGQVAGASNVRVKYCDPLYLDDVAADFPDLRIVMAHPAFPWTDVALSIASRRPNVYMDLSGWSPKYFPPLLVHYANTLLADKVMFGSDYPVLGPERWLRDFAAAPFRDNVRSRILKDTAATVLGLIGEETR
jgi:predicted TIM-barrel fold metal-dependent hydrolase